MTRLEKQAITLSVKLANTVARLPVFDKRISGDIPDAYFHIRAIQNIIMSRDVARVYLLKPKTKKR